MRGTWFVAIGGLCLSVLAAAACVEDRTAPPAGAADGGSSSGTAGCPGVTAQPGGCSPSAEDWCFQSDAPGVAPKCYPAGNTPDSCLPRNLFACAAGGKRCNPGYPCCYGGVVRTTGSACPRTLEPAGTQCDFPEPVLDEIKRTEFGGRPCIDGPARRRLGIVCENDAECAKYDAGACLLSAMPSPADVVLGICSDYDP